LHRPGRQKGIELLTIATSGKQTVGAAVAIMWREHEIVWPEQRQDEVDRRHSGRCHDRARALFKPGERVSQKAASWIGGAGVLFVRPTAPITGKSEGAGQIDWRGDRMKIAIQSDPMSCCDGFWSGLFGHAST